MKKLIGLSIIGICLLSGCIQHTYTEDAKLSKIANSISPPFNVTDNMTYRYSDILVIQGDGWYVTDVYVEYHDAPWINKWWGKLWFNEEGKYHFIERS